MKSRRRANCRKLTALAHSIGMDGNVGLRPIVRAAAERFGEPIPEGAKRLWAFVHEHADALKGTPYETKPKPRKRQKAVDGEIDPASVAFLQTYAWRKLRMQALMRCGRRCACCGRTPEDGITLHVDHIKPHRYHPELALDIDNLQVLCEECNHGKGNWLKVDFRQP